VRDKEKEREREREEEGERGSEGEKNSTPVRTPGIAVLDGCKNGDKY